MMFWRGWSAVLVLLALAGAVPAGAVNGSGAAALFYAKEGGTLQLSWLMDPSSLRYTRGENGLVGAKVVTEISLYSDATLYQEQRFLVQTVPVPTEELSQQHLLLLRSYVLRPGRNRVRLRLYQAEAPEEAWVFEKTVEVPAAPPGQPTFSSLQLLDTSYESRQPSPYLHRGYYQVPKPFAFYADGERSLNFYLELYGAKEADTAQLPLVCRVGLLRKGGIQLLPVAIWYDTLRGAPPALHSFHGTIDLATVASGNYYLTAQLLDRKGRELARQQEALQVVNRQPVAPPVDSTKPVLEAPTDTAGPRKAVTYLNLAETFVGKYKDEQITAILRMLVPVSTESQLASINSFLGHPEPLLARYFIYNYFEEKNPRHPEAAWKQYADKIREVNALFAGRGGTAYASDRGIIYLRYGKPTERIQAYNENGAVPYEVWTYRQLPTTGSPGKFLFYQPPGMSSQFRLLHSTVPGEAYDTQWRAKIYPDGGGSVNSSRAEQEFGN